MRGKVSWWAIFVGDFTPDFLAKFWVYGVTINGVHYGASKPYQFHRGWPGLGISHTLFLGALLTAGIWIWKRSRAWTVGYLLGFAAHVLTDVNDSIGTMLLFPFTTLNWSVQTWAYAAAGGKYRDAAAYYSSLGFMMDVFWLVVVLLSWRVLTKEFWRTQIVPADPHVWSWLGKFLDDRGLLALYRSIFFYGVCRLISWTTWAHFVAKPVLDGMQHDGYPWDLSWTGPDWVQHVTLPHVNPWVVLPMTLLMLGGVYLVASALWDRLEPGTRSASAARNVRR
jgi:membrane-bound metal-dependent hydrolase YbcI (DUF457 family)